MSDMHATHLAGRTFRIEGRFWAVDIDEAFAFLARHFAHLADERSPEPEPRRLDLAIYPLPARDD